MRYVTVFSLVLLVISCADCPPCEEKKGKQTTEKAPPEEPSTDDGKEMTAAPVGGQPKEVKSFDLHARAGFDKVSIWSKPDMDAPRLGYMRKGQRTMVGDPEFSSEGCPKGWFQLPEGGFVCQGRGMLVGTKPRYIHRPPPPPRVDQLDPNPHGFIRRDFTPAYKRVPAEEEIWQIPTRFVPGSYTVVIPDEDAEVPPPVEGDTENPPPAPKGQEVEIVVNGDGDFVFPEGVKFEKKENGEYDFPPGVSFPSEEIPHEDPDAPKDEDPDAEEVNGVDYVRYAKRNFRSVREFLARGFWVSVSRRFRDESTRQYYYETIKGDYVPGNAVHLVKPPEYHGYRVHGDTPLPAAIVSSRHAAFYEKRNSKFRGVGPVDRLSVYRVLESEEYGGSTYHKIEGERYLKSSQVEYFPLRVELPEGVGENEKWILVDLTRQTLEAYEGTMPVFVTLVSTGLPDSEETVTPNGEFTITFKHTTDDMAGSVGDGEEVYMVADVPWVQYIHRNIALHASFWHSKYGTPKSHGCINLSPADARYLFDWTGPHMPEGWHGVSTTEERPGTKVIIVGKTPK